MFIWVLKSKMLKTIALALFLCIAFSQISYGADHIIPSQEEMEEYFWTYGCTPTAASMILSYWDNSSWFGRLIDHYYTNTCGNSDHEEVNVPNTIDELRDAMDTDWSSSTCTVMGRL